MLDPALAFEAQRLGVEQTNVHLDSMPVAAMYAMNDGGILLLAHFPPLIVSNDHEPVNVVVFGQLSAERHGSLPSAPRSARHNQGKQELCGYMAVTLCE